MGSMVNRCGAREEIETGGRGGEGVWSARPPDGLPYIPIQITLSGPTGPPSLSLSS